jgi:P pilus assembly chaperone PapD
MDSKNLLPRSVGKTGLRGFFVFILILSATAINLSASVLVAPTVVFLSEKDRTGRITVQNPSDKPKEITVYLSYGLPTSDSAGGIQMILQDTGITDPRSALTWIKAFPEKMVLGPGATQVVRLRANPPKNLPDGEYWARIVVKSQEGATAIPIPSSADKITTKLNMVMQTAIMLKYRTGNLVSKLEVTKTDVQTVDSAVQVTISMVNRGNVSYVGVLQCRLLDKDGKVISGDDIDLAVYSELTRRIRLPFLPRGSAPHKVDIAISTAGRKDIPEQELITGNVIAYTAAIN